MSPMPARCFCYLVSCACALAVLPQSAAAQWYLGLDVAWTSFGDASSDTSGTSSGVFRPAATTALGLRLERQWSGFGVAVGIRRMHPAMGEDSDVLLVAAKDQMRFTEVAPAVTLRIMRFAAGAALHLQAGPVIDIWEPMGLDARSHVGVSTGLTLVFPLVGRSSGAIRTMLAHSGSPFESADLPDRFAPHGMWRHSVAIGLDLRL